MGINKDQVEGRVKEAALALLQPAKAMSPPWSPRLARQCTDCRRAAVVSWFYGEYSVTDFFGCKSGFSQSTDHFVRHVSSTGQLVGSSGVMKQLAIALEHAR
jgi:hypothetical protein